QDRHVVDRIDGAEDERVARAGTTIEQVAADATLPDGGIVAGVPELDVAVRLRATLDAADQDVVAEAADQHVTAQPADEDVVAALTDQRVGVVEALVGGDVLGLDLPIV